MARKHGLHMGSPIQTSTDGIAGCSMEGYLVLFKSGSTSNYGNAPQIKSKTLWNQSLEELLEGLQTDGF